MVFLNGAEIWKGPGQIWERHALNGEDIRWLHQTAMNAGAEFWVFVPEGRIHKRYWSKELFERNWLKFEMKHNDIEVIQNIHNAIIARKTLEATSSAAFNVEITLKGISKETGVLRVCEHLGITMEHVMAIGDNLNDERLIKAAGLGVAMANADDYLKQVADVVTDSNEQHGVSKAIENYLFSHSSSL